MAEKPEKKKPKLTLYIDADELHDLLDTQSVEIEGVKIILTDMDESDVDDLERAAEALEGIIDDASSEETDENDDTESEDFLDEEDETPDEDDSSDSDPDLDPVKEE
jgi:ribosomal protein L12E/L44/L45/RPP1/RPP2